MTVVFYCHFGYLVERDNTGIAVSWGMNSPGWKARGESMFSHNWTWEFPWWFKPGAIKHRLWIASLNRKERRNG